MTQALRIAFLDHTARMGGGEIALLNLVSTLDQSRYQPIVILFGSGPLQEKLTAAGIETHVLSLSERITDVRKDSLGLGIVLKLRDVLLALAFCWRLSRRLRQLKIDLVHCNSLKSDLLGGLAARLSRIKCIWHVRDRISTDYLPKVVVWTFRWLCRYLPNGVVVNSAATGRVLGNPDAIVVHDGTFLNPAPETPVAGDGLLRVGLIGRITWWKGQDVFIRAAARVRSTFPQARFQIIGSALFEEADYDRSIRELTKQLGVEDIVEFTGFRQDVMTAIHELDLVVHASTTGEPFGQVVIEAMAAGKAVVATNGGGIPEIVTSDCGILVEMKDDRGMAEAIELLLSDPARRHEMGRRARERVSDCFLINHTAAKMQEVFTMTVNSHDAKAKHSR